MKHPARILPARGAGAGFAPCPSRPDSPGASASGAFSPLSGGPSSDFQAERFKRRMGHPSAAADYLPPVDGAAKHGKGLSPSWPALDRSQHRGIVAERSEAGPQATAFSVVVAPCATPGDETPRQPLSGGVLPLIRSTREALASVAGHHAAHHPSAADCSSDGRRRLRTGCAGIATRGLTRIRRHSAWRASGGKPDLPALNPAGDCLDSSVVVAPCATPGDETPRQPLSGGPSRCCMTGESAPQAERFKRRMGHPSAAITFTHAPPRRPLPQRGAEKELHLCCHELRFFGGSEWDRGEVWSPPHIQPLFALPPRQRRARPSFSLIRLPCRPAPQHGAKGVSRRVVCIYWRAGHVDASRAFLRGVV